MRWARASLTTALVVLAVAAGGVLATQHGPRSMDGAATPLTGARQPQPQRSAPTNASLAAGAMTPVRLTLSKLPRGRPPQMPYLTGRVVRGGAGPDLTVPGRERIVTAARFGTELLVVLESERGGELAWLGADGRFARRRVAGVNELVTSSSGAHAAYAVTQWGSGADSASGAGSTIYWESAAGTTPRRSLQGPKGTGSRVLSVEGDDVYFTSFRDDEDSDSMLDLSVGTLHVWQSKLGKVTRIPTATAPELVDHSGRVATSYSSHGNGASCTTVTDLATGKRRWQTCDHELHGFTPDDRTALALPDFATSTGGIAAAVDAATGKPRRQWTGAQFRDLIAEDDQHLLMVADTGSPSQDDVGEGQPTAVIRCTIATGACELATPLTTTTRGTVSLLGAR